MLVQLIKLWIEGKQAQYSSITVVKEILQAETIKDVIAMDWYYRELWVRVTRAIQIKGSWQNPKSLEFSKAFVVLMADLPNRATTTHRLAIHPNLIWLVP